MKVNVISPGTYENRYEAYEYMLNVCDLADIILPLHEPDFAKVDTI